MDLIAFNGALASARHAVSLLRSAADGVKALGKVEVVNQLIDAQVALMDVLDKCQQLQSENHELENKLREFQNLLSLLPKVELHYDALWTRRDDGTLDGPFSPQVWDSERKLMRMHHKERLVFDEETRHQFVCLKFN